MEIVKENCGSWSHTELLEGLHSKGCITLNSVGLTSLSLTRGTRHGDSKSLPAVPIKWHQVCQSDVCRRHWPQSDSARGDSKTERGKP